MQRRLYLSLVALLLVLGVGLWWLGQRPSASSTAATGAPADDEFIRAMQAGKNYLDRAEAARAVEAFTRAVALTPRSADAQLNLASALLLRGQPQPAILAAQAALALEEHSAAAHYLMACAALRLGRLEPAIQSLQTSLNLDPNVPAAYFQLGRANLELGRFAEAIGHLQQAIELQPDHPTANFSLSQALAREGQAEDSAKALLAHQRLRTQNPSLSVTVDSLEKCKHTQARLPFRKEEPSSPGIPVRFVDDTGHALGSLACAGPAAFLDVRHDGQLSLLVREGDRFRLLANSNGVFTPQGPGIVAAPQADPFRCLVGDLQNDRVEDVVVLGSQACQVFRFNSNGMFMDVTSLCGLRGVPAREGVLADLDFTGALDFLVVSPTNGELRMFRNLKNFYFKEVGATSAVPQMVQGGSQIVLEDWNGDDVHDLFWARQSGEPQFFSRLRGGKAAATNAPGTWPSGAVIAVGDLDNDLRPDLLVAGASGRLEVVYNGQSAQRVFTHPLKQVTQILLVDYDNDGWLDVLLVGQGICLLRNAGSAGLLNVTAAAGLDQGAAGDWREALPGDYDNDGDTDLVLCPRSGRLKLLRNDGGHAHQQLKLRLAGTRSNASGLGVRLEVAAGGLHLSRTVSRLPVEIGVGRHPTVDAVTVGWFDLTLSTVDLKPEKRPVELLELYFPKGSCPYLYAWDGQKFDFVSDFLGNAPLGLRVSQSRFVEADPLEHLWLGDSRRVQPRSNHFVLQITEELSEVLYLDQARLIAVDHPAGTQAHSTSKMRPGGPFPPSRLALLDRPRPLLRAVRQDGLEVTGLLHDRDQRMVGPVTLRSPQLRGLCEPYSVTLDFGLLEPAQPLVLALTGWIRFGGGMANVAGSHCPDLPFPFPTLECETLAGQWQPVPVMVGVPSGKTKTILVDLTGKLPATVRRLRLTTAFEVYWDQAALLHPVAAPEWKVTEVLPSSAHLHWRGYSDFKPLPPELPLTPDYLKVRNSAQWRIIPGGWATRYGEVAPLLAQRDDAFVLVNGGDELTLRFPASAFPALPEGWVRDFFVFTVGWDKDTDYHVEAGTTIEPWPWQGMDDQRYGHQPRPATAGDALMRAYTTRWVSGHVPEIYSVRSMPPSSR
jgi:Flp pilus assembly protein TadD